MRPIHLIDDELITPLGFTTAENLSALRSRRSGLKGYPFPSGEGTFSAGTIEKDRLITAFGRLGDPSQYTRLEQMLLLALSKLLSRHPRLDLSRTRLILATTKGNIELLQDLGGFPKKRLLLSELGKVIADFFGLKVPPVVVSNACISGGLALAVARHLIHSGSCSHALVLGGDLVSDFVVSGFHSFQALSPKGCRPFSKDRDGISLGEAAAAVLVSRERPEETSISLIADATANDANHISGPSRTGEGLFLSIKKALAQADLSPGAIGLVSAHGTATPFNDEMEALAFNRMGLQQVPLHSLKGYYGHSLGGSALVESIITRRSMLQGELIPSLNYQDHGVSEPLNIIRTYQKQEIPYALKTASGFGGCNLALVFKREQ